MYLRDEKKWWDDSMKNDGDCTLFPCRVVNREPYHYFSAVDGCCSPETYDLILSDVKTQLTDRYLLVALICSEEGLPVELAVLILLYTSFSCATCTNPLSLRPFPLICVNCYAYGATKNNLLVETIRLEEGCRTHWVRPETDIFICGACQTKSRQCAECHYTLCSDDTPPDSGGKCEYCDAYLCLQCGIARDEGVDDDPLTIALCTLCADL